MIDLLIKDYAFGWEGHLVDAHIKFRSRWKEADKAQKNNEESKYDAYWKRYSRWTRTSSDEGQIIENRHEFFLSEMLEILSSHLRKKDTERIFSDLQRTIIYIRDKKQCQWCLKEGKPHEVLWEEMEIHHVIPHHQGGKTDLSNGALMHKGCHPRSEENTNAFNRWWNENKNETHHIDEELVNRKSVNGLTLKDMPNNTICKATFQHKEYRGEILAGKILIAGIQQEFSSFSAASVYITNTSRNGWRDWQIWLPEENRWIFADDWRQGVGR